MEKYLIDIGSPYSIVRIKYEIEVMSIFGAKSHLYSLAAHYETLGCLDIDDTIDKELILKISNPDDGKRSLTITAKKVL